MATVSLDIAPGSEGIPITIGRGRMQRLAKHWHFVLRSRRRWIADSTLRETIERRAADHLAAMGVGKDTLQHLASSDVVQVSISHSSDPQSLDSGWEARLMPWEYLLTAATGKYRNGPLFVVRHLKTSRLHEPLLAEKFNATFVDSAPGRLRSAYTFDIEQKVLEVHLGDSAQWEELPNPTLAIIRDSMMDRSPGLIHISGIDSFLGKRLLAESDKPASGETDLRDIPDGMYLRNEEWDEVLVQSRSLAEALAAAPRKPALVAFNLYNSSARSAAFTVAEGANAALGVQDFLDDGVTEIFFANFYLNWRLSGWNTLGAFKSTLSGLKPYVDPLRGSGIVLWSSTSLLEAPVPATSKPKRKKAKGQKTKRPTSSISHACAASDIVAEVEPIQALNYSILHNRQPIFGAFSIYKFHPAVLSDLHVEVELHIGNERFGYRSSFAMSDHMLDLSKEISIGLTSAMARSLQESVQTTLFVRISLGDKPILSKTFPITLLPTDEWRDDEVNGIWLPSFVLPRDQTVLEVIVAAQRYLMALRDDAFAGFDGYQAIDESTADTANVDAQVRAIWYALLHDYRLNYINPPPVFTTASQRLRTPTDVIRGGRGTCIDLALLIAACLEFIDIKPVIFLLNGHAFPGYWSSEAIRQQFLVGRNPLPLMEAPDNPTPLPNEEEEESSATEAFVQRFPWELDSSRYNEVIDAVREGDIVPLESTMLTTGGGFWEAIDQAIDNLGNPDDFHSMLDIGLARDNHVTPLPLASLPDQGRAKP